MTDLQDTLPNGILNNELTLTMKNIDAIQATTAQLITNKKEPEKYYSRQLKRNKFILTQIEIEIYDIDFTGSKSADHFEKET